MTGPTADPYPDTDEMLDAPHETHPDATLAAIEQAVEEKIVPCRHS